MNFTCSPEHSRQMFFFFLHFHSNFQCHKYFMKTKLRQNFAFIFEFIWIIISVSRSFIFVDIHSRDFIEKPPGCRVMEIQEVMKDSWMWFCRLFMKIFPPQHNLTQKWWRSGRVMSKMCVLLNILYLIDTYRTYFAVYPWPHRMFMLSPLSVHSPLVTTSIENKRWPRQELSAIWRGEIVHCVFVNIKRKMRCWGIKIIDIWRGIWVWAAECVEKAEKNIKINSILFHSY